MELTPARVYLMYVIPLGFILLLSYVLYPEIVVRNRFEPAVCKVFLDKVWPDSL